MVDIGNPAGFDVATVLTGSGVTLLISAGIVEYGDEVQLGAAELYALSGSILAGLGVLFGILLVASGHR